MPCKAKIRRHPDGWQGFLTQSGRKIRRQDMRGEQARVVENKPNSVLRPKVVGLTTGTVYDLAEDVNCASILIE